MDETSANLHDLQIRTSAIFDKKCHSINIFKGIYTFDSTTKKASTQSIVALNKLEIPIPLLELQ